MLLENIRHSPKLLQAVEPGTKDKAHTWTFMVWPVGLDGKGRPVYAGQVRYPSYYPGPTKGSISIVLSDRDSRFPDRLGHRKVIAIRPAETQDDAFMAAERVVKTGRSGYGPHNKDDQLSWQGVADRDIWIDHDEDS